MPYPVKADLVAYLEAKGVGASALARIDPLLDDALDSAVAAWETATGYSPFLVEPDTLPTVRKFGVQHGFVEFGTGLLGPDDILLDGALPTTGEFFLNTAFSERPAHAYRTGFWNSTARNVEFTGVWGACTVLPKGVASAILSIAAAGLASAISAGSYAGGEITKEKIGEVETTYSTSSSTTGIKAGSTVLPAAAQALAKRYRRPSSGIA